MKDEELPCAPFSDGEIAFFRRFLRDGENGWTLKASAERWGFCERHVFGLLAIAASIPRAGMHTASALFSQATTFALTAIERFLEGTGSVHSFDTAEPCAMCELGLNEGSPAPIHRGWLALPRTLTRLQSLLASTRPYWVAIACLECTGAREGLLCRPHLIEAQRGEGAGARHRLLEIQQRGLEGICERLNEYLRTFEPDAAASAPGDGVAAVVAAAGWCAGWHLLWRADGSKHDPEPECTPVSA